MVCQVAVLYVVVRRRPYPPGVPTGDQEEAVVPSKLWVGVVAHRDLMQADVKRPAHRSSSRNRAWVRTETSGTVFRRGAITLARASTTARSRRRPRKK